MSRSLELSKKRVRCGAAAVEFAIAAPVFFALFFAAVEVTRVNQISNTAEIAATEGARRGIVPGARAADCVAGAREELQAVGISSFQVTTIPAEIESNTRSVRVQVDIDLLPSNGIFISGLFAGKQVSRSIELLRE